MYLTFLFKRCSLKENDLCVNSILFASYIEIINFLYYVANFGQSQRYLKKYFYGEKIKITYRDITKKSKKY